MVYAVQRDVQSRFDAPLPRLAVDEQLAKRGLVPTEVSLTIPTQPTLGVRAVSMHTEHKVNWRLLPRNLSRISETASQLAAFKAVSLDEFLPRAVTKR